MFRCQFLLFLERERERKNKIALFILQKCVSTNASALFLTLRSFFKISYHLFYNCIAPLEFLPLQIRFAFPRENQLQQSRATRPALHAGCCSVSIIHRTLTWTTGSLTYVNACDCTRGSTDTVRESALKVDSWEKKSLAAPGNRTCLRGVPVRCSTN